MNKRAIIWSSVAIAIVAAVLVVLATKHRLETSNQLITSRTYQIGQDLIAHSSSQHLAGLPPGLAGQLANLLGSPTRVSAVLLGDEPPPIGDGSACSRLILTNERAKGMELRLCSAPTSDKFRIMGYWPTSVNPGVM